jgi:hypothetical protein
VLARTRPAADAPGLLPVCFRCGAAGGAAPGAGPGTSGSRVPPGAAPALSAEQPAPRAAPQQAGRSAPGSRDTCSACGTRYVRSFLTFESLPVVEMRPAPGISDAEVRSAPAAGRPGCWHGAGPLGAAARYDQAVRGRRPQAHQLLREGGGAGAGAGGAWGLDDLLDEQAPAPLPASCKSWAAVGVYLRVRACLAARGAHLWGARPQLDNRCKNRCGSCCRQAPRAQGARVAARSLCCSSLCCSSLVLPRHDTTKTLGQTHRARQGWDAGAAAPPLLASRGALRRCPACRVLVRRWPGGAPGAQLFIRLDAVLPLALGAGGQLYEEDELAAAAMAGWAAPPLLSLAA